MGFFVFLRRAESTRQHSASLLGLVLFMALAVLILPRVSNAGLFAIISRILGSGRIEIEETLPALLPITQASVAASALDADNRPPAGDESHDAAAFNIVQENALLAPLNPIGTMVPDTPPSGQIFVYTIRPGDTLSAVAKSFDVSVNTILWANNISDPRSLKVGDQLVILPVSGVRHEVKKGDTASVIAKRYRASLEDVLRYNGLAADEVLIPGNVVIVPNGELAYSSPLTSGGVRRSLSNLPAYDGFFMRPIVAGRRSRGLHGYNGVDLANSCGLPVLASAEGQVLITRSVGWNGGYGRYVVIAHRNGTQTLYGHLREVTAVPGQAVGQGELIGTIGSSGNSTGCHLHFEVRGAKNPF